MQGALALQYLYTPGGGCGDRKLFSRSRRTSFSMRTWAGSLSLGSLAGRMASDCRKVALSLREDSAARRAGGVRLSPEDTHTHTHTHTHTQRYKHPHTPVHTCTNKDTHTQT